MRARLKVNYFTSSKIKRFSIFRVSNYNYLNLKIILQMKIAYFKKMNNYFFIINYFYCDEHKIFKNSYNYNNK